MSKINCLIPATKYASSLLVYSDILHLTTIQNYLLSICTFQTSNFECYQVIFKVGNCKISCSMLIVREGTHKK